jgi:hypothetical protein
VKNQAGSLKAEKRRLVTKILKNPTKYMKMQSGKKRKKKRRTADNTKPFVTYSYITYTTHL